MNRSTVGHTYVFNIQKYSVHDGPGIRTIVFLKGCPLKCPWCANPEGRSYRPVLSHSKTVCQRCGRCVGLCPQQAIRLDEEGIHIDRKCCVLCGKCVFGCGMDCYKIIGEERSAKDVLKEVAKDENFYFRSGGGMTVSGGEPLAHPDYLIELLKGAKETLNISTTIETTCYAPEAVLRRVIEYVDYVIADIKLVDNKRSLDTLGVLSEPILHNIRVIADEYPEKELLIRTPVIPGYNDDLDNMKAVAAFIRSLKRPVPIELLPYHEFGKAKYANLDMVYEPALRQTEPPSKERMEELTVMLKNLGVTVIHT